MNTKGEYCKMKKLVSLFAFSFLLLLVFSINVSANEIVVPGGYVSDEEYEEAVPEEGFVEVEELIPSEDTSFEGEGLLVPTSPGTGITTNSIIRTGSIWNLVSKTKKPDSYGSTWKTCVDDISRSGSVSCTITVGISNTYSGTIKVPIKTIEANLGYGLTKSNSIALRKSYTITKGERVKIIYRPVYTTYQLKQQRKLGSRVLETAYVTSRKYSHVQYDIIKY